MVVNGFRPGIVGDSAARTERANNGNVQEKTFAGRAYLSIDTALPKGEPRHRFTATLNARAARKSDGRKRFPSRHPLPLPVGEVAERSEDGEGK